MLSTMAVLRFVALFAFLIATAFALQCYSEKTNGVDQPSKTIDCGALRSQYCIKNHVSTDGVTTASYGCAPESACSTTGCTSPIRGSTTCCCNTDLCNSSSMSSLIPAMIPLAIMKLFVF